MVSLLLMLACAPAPTPAPAEAGCTMEEARTAVWNPAPWSVLEQTWDDAGRLVLQRRSLDPDSPSALHEEFSWRWDGDRLVEETAIAWQDPAAPGPPIHTGHDYDAAGHRVTTRRWFDEDAPIGTWYWDLDASGRPAGGTWDAGDDGVVDGTRVEVWLKEPFGWRVASEDRVDGLPPSLEERELDEDERELWRTEDWDADGVSEVVEQHVFDEAGRLTDWDLSGASVIDESCTYRWSGDVQTGATCTDDLHDGRFEWTWRHDAGRPRQAVVTHDGDDGSTEAWEHVEYTWTCR